MDFLLYAREEFCLSIIYLSVLFEPLGEPFLIESWWIGNFAWMF